MSKWKHALTLALVLILSAALLALPPVPPVWETAGLSGSPLFLWEAPPYLAQIGMGIQWILTQWFSLVSQWIRWIFPMAERILWVVERMVIPDFTAKSGPGIAPGPLRLLKSPPQEFAPAGANSFSLFSAVPYPWRKTMREVRHSLF